MESDQRHLKTYSRGFWICMFLNILFVVWMKQWIYPLQTGDIILLEIARTVPVASSLMEEFSLDPLKIEKLRASVYLDFIFIFMYCSLLIFAVRYLSRLTSQDLLIRAARFFTVIIVLAGVCDIAENILLLRTISGSLEEWTVRMTYNFAAAKFSMIIITLLFVLVEGMFVLGGLFGRRVIKVPGQEM